MVHEGIIKQMQIIQMSSTKLIKISELSKYICRKINIPRVLDMLINTLHQFPTSSTSPPIKLKMGNSKFHALGAFTARVLECRLGSIDELLGVLEPDSSGCTFVYQVMLRSTCHC